jgi:hypothetical protein
MNIGEALERALHAHIAAEKLSREARSFVYGQRVYWSRGSTLEEVRWEYERRLAEDERTWRMATPESELASSPPADILSSPRNEKG